MDLSARIATHARTYTYYKLLHDLERLGCYGPERLKVRPAGSRMFPARDICDVHLEGVDGSTGELPKADVVVSFGGLYGVDSPLPMYFDDILDEDSPASANLRGLLSLVGNRFYHLLYEIWSRMAPMFCAEQALENYVRKPALSICGLGHLKGARINVLAGAAFLVQGMRNRWGLAAMLESFLGAPVDVVDFDPARVPLRDRERTRLGDADTAVLGRTFRATPYRDTFTTHVRVVCGPLGCEKYIGLLPGGELHSILSYLTFRYLPADLEYRVELVLAADAVKELRFQLKPGLLRLGATTVLGASRIRREIRIIREGISLASRPEQLREIIEFIESRGPVRSTGTRNEQDGEAIASLKSA